MNFDQAFEILVNPQHEGGYVNNPHDRGGPTKFGISQTRYPAENIAEVTLARAKYLYLKDYWGPAGCDAMPDCLKYDMFDTAVTSGPSQAIKFIQKALKLIEDGKLGPNTLLAVGYIDPYRLLVRFDGCRLDYLNNNPEQFKIFGRGWTQRIAENMMMA